MIVLSKPSARGQQAGKAGKWGVLLIATCAGLSACQRPAQPLPAAPVFTIPAPEQRPQPAQRALPAVLPAAPQFQPYVGPAVIFFDGDSAELGAAARAILDRQAEWLLLNPRVTAVMLGHADLLGTRARQFAIGEMRATAMRRYLVARGVPPNRIVVTSYGKQQPVSTALDEESQRRNRRGETVFRGVAGLSEQ